MEIISSAKVAWGMAALACHNKISSRN
jgi:short-subunit dehydrogenase involved in D-alanine esterification of teichoic acids